MSLTQFFISHNRGKYVSSYLIIFFSFGPYPLYSRTDILNRLTFDLLNIDSEQEHERCRQLII
jgi:hypothetical protein